MSSERRSLQDDDQADLQDGGTARPAVTPVAGRTDETPAVDEGPPVLRIEPVRRWWAPRLGDLWAYRELLYFLAWRDVKVRYKQTVLGAGWALLQPTLTMVVFTLFFGRLAGIPSDGVPYPVFSFAGLLPWTYFAVAVGLAANSLVNDQSLVTKVYFPRPYIPAAPAIAGLIDLALAGVVLGVLMAVYSVAPSPAIVALPALIVLAIVTVYGASLWLSALNVRFRDVKYAVPFIIQIWLFMSPVAYPSSLLEQPWRALYGLNPMAGVVDGFRWALVGTPLDGLEMLLSCCSAVIILVGGFLFFRRTERSFADVI